MSAHLDTLHRMNLSLSACTRGELPTAELLLQWRRDGLALPLPERFAEVLAGLLDRVEASALFSGDSCSFSQQDLFDSLRLWAEKAKARLQSPATGL
jgi:hypothetical protein